MLAKDAERPKQGSVTPFKVLWLALNCQPVKSSTRPVMPISKEHALSWGYKIDLVFVFTLES